MPCAPSAPSCDHHRQNFQLDSGASQFAHHWTARELVPKRIRLVVVHELVGAVEKARRSEDKGFASSFHPRIEKDPRSAQRSVGKRNRNASDHVIKHLMPVHESQRIGANVTIDLDAEDELVLGEIVRRGRGD